MTSAAAYASRNVDFADAIRSIALQEIEGEDVGDRTAHLSNYMRLPVDQIRFQVAEMIDVLRD